MRPQGSITNVRSSEVSGTRRIGSPLAVWVWRNVRRYVKLGRSWWASEQDEE